MADYPPLLPPEIVTLSSPVKLATTLAATIVRCNACGAALLIDPAGSVDVVALHRQWHANRLAPLAEILQRIVAGESVAARPADAA
jgi:hypothetical protein